VLVYQAIDFIVVLSYSIYSRRALGFVALQRKTADNFRLALRLALENSDLSRI
jgi:hypothetical protein